jgi:hypothetical protein
VAPGDGIEQDDIGTRESFNVANRSAFLSMAERRIVGALGVAMLVLGVVSSFIISSGTAPAAMLALGGGLVVLGIVGDRLTSMKVGNVEFQLEHVRELVALADSEMANGNIERAAALRSEAITLLRSPSLVALENRYESIRASTPGSRARTSELEQLLMEVRTLARHQGWTPQAVVDKFTQGSDGSRITALAVLEELPELHVFAPIENALSEPRSNMEQYHALVAAEASVPYLSGEEQAKLKALLSGLDGKMGGDRQRVLRRVVTALGAFGRVLGDSAARDTQGGDAPEPVE